MGLLASAGLAAADVVKIGVLAPVSGPQAADGQEMVNGAQLAVDELNAAGGVAGHTFELVVGDVVDGAADKVTTAAERLLGDRDMGAIMTGYASGSNFEIELMAEMEMVYIVSANSGQTEDIISPDPAAFPTVWSMTPSYSGYNTGIVPVIEGLADEGSLRLPNRKVALIASDNPYSKGIADGMVEAFESAGWEVVTNDLVPFGEINDWRGFLGTVRDAEPAVIINTDYVSSNAALFVSQFNENPTNSLVFIQYAPSVPEFIELTKEQSSGIVYNLLGGILNTPTNPRAAEVIAKYRDAYGGEPGTYGAALYEQVHIYATALGKVGDPAERIAIGEAIGASSTQTAMGMVSFDPETHLAVQSNEGIPLQFYQIQDGEHALFYPPVYATDAFVEPRWMK
ncbi:ABC transporter substrate-binding protein [Roseovarius atlanticus]|uniref:ABC transporter substrate-binding protein n=2 Tax=Roseovarius TaxID=74030 RepID=UPI001C93913A|nr:ABC transporter substrate-binding protein [Roseovarius atlanticus]MBY5989962.1 ABC transporter substrate-binding protein [Roseovarius atlanticus]MBY6126507.1 ABC transporter substrate-binding protein [Roseovarius atlanticus]MBY6151001.1 ABC transporter substrate-binding protein [Roseovarius atlanticus]